MASTFELEVANQARQTSTQRRGDRPHRRDLLRERRWGSERIRGELLKLGIVVSNRSIRRYRWPKSTPTRSQSWRTFLSNELKGIWAADLFVVHTINYKTLYVF